MFFKIIFSYVLGYVNVIIEGYYIERFINICKQNKIAVWKLEKNKNISVKLNVGLRDFKEICKIARKTKCRIKINCKKGLPFFMNRYKKRKIFFALLALFVLILGISSNFVWNIEIKEEKNNIPENIRQDIEEAGLKIGELKNKINTKDIVNKIKLKRNDIAWMGIELKGTNAIVKIVTSEEKPSIVDEDEYCSIVSDKTGIITKINAQTGTANVKVGDTVNVGDTLIQGWMEGQYTGIRYVHSKGEIEAKVWHSKHKKIYFNSIEKIETGRFENKYAIKFNNFTINFAKKLSKFEIYDTIEKENQLKIFSEIYLPISIVKTTYKELKEEQKQYSNDEAKTKGISDLENELNEEMNKQGYTEKIVGENINTYESEDGVDVFVTYEVLENIGINEKIVF